ncbi:hypothetical protein CKW46_16300 [Mycobacterium liflandii]|nr:hypothetical protein CKW46_16300 [Mycobacterium liflandii]
MEVDPDKWQAPTTTLGGMVYPEGRLMMRMKVRPTRSPWLRPVDDAEAKLTPAEQAVLKLLCT